MRRLGLVALLLVASAGCIGWRTAFGYRARQLALARDVVGFEALMQEAAESEPAGPLDDPERTVLTHFLDLAGEPEFFGVLARWRERGWIGDEATCAVHRAHHRAMRARDPATARRSADLCVERARAAAAHAERAWEITACLEEAPFLVESSTAAVAPYLALANDGRQPEALRLALLEGIAGYRRAHARVPHGEVLDREARRARDEAARAAQRGRLEWMASASGQGDSALLFARATASAALELEADYVSRGQSFFAPLVASPDPARRALPWAWVLEGARQAREPMAAGGPREPLEQLGLWPEEADAPTYWYLCAARPEPPSKGGGLVRVEAKAVRARRALEARALRERHCPDATVYPTVLGPLPLEASAKAALREQLAAELPTGQRPALVIRERVIVEDDVRER